MDSSKTYLENLVEFLKPKLALNPGETDMLVMQHRFKIERSDGTLYNLKSTLIGIGEKKGFSAMSKLVGVPTAIAV